MFAPQCDPVLICAGGLVWWIKDSLEHIKLNFNNRCTYILIGGLVQGDQVCVEAGQSNHRPKSEEAHQHLQHSELKLRKQQQMFSAWLIVTNYTADGGWWQNSQRLRNLIIEHSDSQWNQKEEEGKKKKTDQKEKVPPEFNTNQWWWPATVVKFCTL